MTADRVAAEDRRVTNAMAAGHSPDLSRREFMAASGALVLASALVVADCAVPEASGAAAGPPRWVRVSIGGLVAGQPRWVEFGVPAAPSQPTSASPRPVMPSGTPADSLAPSRGGAWLVLGSGGALVAFSPKCTHRGCLYDWDGAAAEFRCRCHPGLFGIDGKVLGGPPPRPLRRFETRQAGAGEVEIGWVEETY